MQRIIAACLLGVGVLAILAATPNRSQGQDTVKYDGKTLTEWLGLLKNGKTPKVRQAVIIYLEARGQETSSIRPMIVAGFIEALQMDPSEEVRAAAAQTLGGVGGDWGQVTAEKIAAALKPALAKDKAPEVRQAVAKALGGNMAKYAEAIQELAKALKDTDPGTRAAAAAALKDYGKYALEVMPQLLDVAKDAKLDYFTRIYALQILTKHSKDSGKLVPVLVEVAKDKGNHLTLRQAAVDGLSGFYRDAIPATDELINILRDPKAPILLRQAVAGALAKIQPESGKVWPTLKTLMEADDSAIRAQAVHLAAKLCKEEKELVPSLIKRADDDNVDTQIAAIQELGELGPTAKAAETALKNLVNTSGRPTVREAASAALKKIQATGG